MTSTMAEEKNQAKIILFPTKTPYPVDPEELLRFTIENEDEFFIKAKYREVIREFTRIMLNHFSELSN